jgi:hypothetical protein
MAQGCKNSPWGDSGFWAKLRSTVEFSPTDSAGFGKIRRTISPVSIKFTGQFRRVLGESAGFDTTKIFEDIVAVTVILFDRSSFIISRLGVHLIQQQSLPLLARLIKREN